MTSPRFASSIFDFYSPSSPRSLDQLLDSSQKGEGSWLHLSFHGEREQNWLKKFSGIPNDILLALTATKVRPRFTHHKNCFLLVLRLPESLTNEEHEDLRSIRIYVDEKRVISTSAYPLELVSKLMKKWGKKNGPNSSTGLLLELVRFTVNSLESTLEDMEDMLDESERQILQPGQDPAESELSVISLEALHLRRCLAPQKEVLLRVAKMEELWLSEEGRRKLMEAHEKVCRQLEEVETLRERSRILKEEVSSHIGAQLNDRVYLFSLIAVIFLPLGFLTGLLGVNLGGIPGAEHSGAFLAFCAFLIGITGIIGFSLRKLHWL